jgi:hypothetical protein
MQGGGIVAVLALLVPIIMMAIAFVPPYAAAIIALWGVYGDVILSKWLDFELVVGTLQKLYHQWEVTPELSWWNFFIPVFAPVIVGGFLSAWWMYLFLRYVKGVFSA